MNSVTMSKIDQYFQELEEQQIFSGTILVAKDNDIIISKGYGMANHDYDIPNTSKTKFCIASITKSITAMGILILTEQKKLSLNDTLDQYIPGFSNGEKITIYQVITHTSGICEIYNDLKSEMFGHQNNKLQEVIEKFKDKPLEFEPGEKFQYSNLGYNILAHIIEKVSGKTYEQFIKENIFDKLSMKDTGCFTDEQVLKNSANGYSKSVEGIVNTKNLHFSNLCGSGNLYSTVEDLYAWAKALREGKLLSSEYSKKIFEDHEFVEDNYYYGYGFVVFKPNDNIEQIYQDGGLPGFKTIYMIYPNTGLTVIILSNYDFIKIAEILEKLEELIK